MRRFSFVVLVFCVLAAIAGPASAGFENGPDDPPGPVERSQEVVAVSYVDADDGLVALGGNSPEEGCFGQGFDELGEAQRVLLRSGAIVTVTQDRDQSMRVYEASSIDEICERVFAGELVEPIASGTVRTVITDNDFDVSLTRTNSFGDHSAGTLSTPDGRSCTFRGVFRAQISVDGEFRLLKEDMVLRC